jgi:hypothetical protein
VERAAGFVLVVRVELLGATDELGAAEESALRP